MPNTEWYKDVAGQAKPCAKCGVPITKGTKRAVCRVATWKGKRRYPKLKLTYYHLTATCLGMQQFTQLDWDENRIELYKILQDAAATSQDSTTEAQALCVAQV